MDGVFGSVAIRVLGKSFDGSGAGALPENRRQKMEVLKGRGNWSEVL